jgi:anti-sigma factor RsiW
MSDQWTDRLSEYLDGELPGAERAALEEHLSGCAGCAATLAELRQVVARAGALDDRAPQRELWAGISERIGAGGVDGRRAARRRWRGLRLTLTVPQLAAAALALMTLSAGSVWLTRPKKPVMQQANTGAVAPATLTPVSPVALVEGAYESAVRDLQKVLDEGRGRLDTATVRVLEQNLRMIDAAITECRRALVADPASAYLNAHLAETMKQKLELLRRAVRLTAART